MASPCSRGQPGHSRQMGDQAPQKVTLHLYDLSQGMARAMSAQLLGKQLDGIWHTGIVCFGQGP